ncbi:type ISP restriction/modification enzyme [Acetobacter aceti]
MTASGGERSGFGALMISQLPDLHVSPNGSQVFPLYVYDLENKDEK